RVGPSILREVEPDALQPLLRVEVARPFPARKSRRYIVGLRGDTHHFGAAPGNRANVGFFLAILVDHELFRGIDLGDGVGDFEVENIRRPLQSLGMFGALEDLSGVGAFALEHATRVVQAMAQNVEVGLVPGHELSFVPGARFDRVIALNSHYAAPSPRPYKTPARCPRDRAFFAPISTLYVLGQHPV